MPQNEGAESIIEQVCQALGGRNALGKALTSQLEVHDAITEGIPGRAAAYLIKHVSAIKAADLLSIFGISPLAGNKLTSDQSKGLNQGQGARLWVFAEILVKATKILGTQELAEQWMMEPAIALEMRRPIDLLSSPVGATMVSQLLDRLEYGVYT